MDNSQVEQVLKQKYQNLKINDDFIFSKVMKDPLICKSVLEILLDVKIKELTFLEEQKQISNRRAGKSIVLDIVLMDGHTIYNIEMQNSNYYNLHKRAPHYFHTIANYFSRSKQDYLDLSNIFVIFICNFDPFYENLHKYTFNYICNENKDIVLNDGSAIIYFNTKASFKEENQNVRKLLEYFSGKYDQNNSTQLVDIMQNKVLETLKNQEWEDEYMKYNCDMQDIKRAGVELGIGIGEKRGISIGEKRGIDIGEKRGISIGEKLGIDIGRQEEKINLARKMYGKLSNEEIMSFTGFSIDVIEDLAKENDINND